MSRQKQMRKVHDDKREQQLKKNKHTDEEEKKNPVPLFLK